jgi:hypothetical protein
MLLQMISHPRHSAAETDEQSVGAAWRERVEAGGWKACMRTFSRFNRNTAYVFLVPDLSSRQHGAL